MSVGESQSKKLTQLVVFDFPIGNFYSWEGIEELELHNGRGIERFAIFASIPDDSMTVKEEARSSSPE